jgi:hypothetical protein
MSILSMLQIYNIRVGILSFINSFNDFLNMRRVRNILKDTIDENTDYINNMWLYFINKLSVDKISIGLYINHTYYMIEKVSKLNVKAYYNDLYYILEDTDTINFLISHGIKPKCEHIKEALYQNKIKVVDILLKSDRLLTYFEIAVSGNFNRYTYCVVEASKVSLDMMEVFIRNGANPNIPNISDGENCDERNESFIYNLCKSGSYKVLERLFKLEKEGLFKIIPTVIHALQENSSHLLLLSAKSGHEDICTLLASNYNLLDSYKNHNIIIQFFGDKFIINPKIIKCLLIIGVNINEIKKIVLLNVRTPYYKVNKADRYYIIKFFYDKGVSIELPI